MLSTRRDRLLPDDVRRRLHRVLSGAPLPAEHPTTDPAGPTGAGPPAPATARSTSSADTDGIGDSRDGSEPAINPPADAATIAAAGETGVSGGRPTRPIEPAPGPIELIELDAGETARRDAPAVRISCPSTPVPAADRASEPDDGAAPATDRAGADEPPSPGRFGHWWADSGRALGLRHALLDPGRRGVRALLLACAAAMVAAGLVAWHLRPVTDPVAAPVKPPRSAAADPSPAHSKAARLVVAVAGKVRHPGLVRLPPGSRVADAIKAAGGPLPGTDLGLLNLARKVVDGEQILVGVTASPRPAAPAGTNAPGAAPGTPIDLNTATEQQLDTLPGIGPALAGRIISYRTEHGGFHSVAELKQVSGIGEARYADLKDLVTV